MHYAILVFPGFEALDAFGPLEILNVLAENTKLRLSILSTTLDPVSTRSPDPSAYKNGSLCSQSIVPTATLGDFLESKSEVSRETGPIDVLIVPGGAGTRFPDVINPYIDFVERYTTPHVLSVCNGAGVLARAGILDGKRATTNKMLWESTTALRAEVDWVKEARWVVDGHVWTSSGVTAGMDAMLAFVRELYGKEMAVGIAREIEYVWDSEQDGTDDPFAVGI